MSAEQRLTELQLALPPTPKPAGLYRPIALQGSLAFLSGHGPLRPDGTKILGRLGEDLDLDAGKLAARQTGLALLATLRDHFGSLDRVRRVVKLFGMVNATPEFHQHARVIDGCSELFAELFGSENGVGVRSAAGMTSLPGNMAVEIEAIFEIEP